MTMEGSNVPGNSIPSGASEAILKKSDEMPPGSQKVEELDFNKFTGRSITADELVEGMSNMGFQASSIGEAVKIINDMVLLNFFLLPICTTALKLDFLRRTTSSHPYI